MIRAHGLAHATLTVSDIERTKKFYEDLFDTTFEMDDEKVFSLVTVGIPVWFVQWSKQKSGDRFDETRIGLDHIAFKLENVSVLEKIIERLKDMGVETKGFQKFAGKYPYVAFRDPDNIQTEFFIPKEV
jgi:glyoxylase I family protein